MIKILFFGRLRELLNCSELEFTQFEQGTVAELRQALAQQGDDWAEFIVGEHALVAVNQQMGDEQLEIQSGDEVAFFPPVTGG